MIRRETSFILLLVCVMSAACGREQFPARPELPQSVPPAWTLSGIENSPMPPGLPAGVSAQCAKAIYTNGKGGSAGVWVCAYAQDSSAFNALQRTPAEANTVKFQEGKRLTLVKWNGGSREEVKALVLAIQRAVRISGR